ncbi:hypothetical protein PNA54_07335 [Enterococcus faecium]|nr:hypothetical protein [Enterococcus faecium]MDB7363731.1 hypothetical protein [Enterococcus faecium]
MKSKIKLFLTTCLLAVAFAIPITTVHVIQIPSRYWRSIMKNSKMNTLPSIRHLKNYFELLQSTIQFRDFRRRPIA